jgi:hypothetical protein
MITIPPGPTLPRLLLELYNAYKLKSTDTYLGPAISPFCMYFLYSQISPLNNNVFREGPATIRTFSVLHRPANMESFTKRAFIRDYHLWLMRDRLSRPAPSSNLCFLGRRSPSEPD